MVEVRQRWYRIHGRDRDPLFYGRSGANRFDSPADEYGVLPVGTDAFCAFIETFGHVAGRRRVTSTQLNTRSLAIIDSASVLRLVDLTGPGLARLGADERLCAGDYDAAQQWSAAFHDHPEQPDGLLNRSRHDASRLCAAIYERTGRVLAASHTNSLTAPDARNLLATLLETYGFELIETDG